MTISKSSAVVDSVTVVPVPHNPVVLNPDAPAGLSVMFVLTPVAAVVLPVPAEFWL